LSLPPGGTDVKHAHDHGAASPIQLDGNEDANADAGGLNTQRRSHVGKEGHQESTFVYFCSVVLHLAYLAHEIFNHFH
jgi:hypothetical protein